MFWKDKREKAETVRLKRREAELCLITYYVYHGLDIDGADRQLRKMGYTVEMIEDVWETKVRDLDIFIWVMLTGGKVRPS